MAEDIIRKYYVDLIKLLPMNDVIFIAELYSAGLLPGDLKAEVQFKPTGAHKADHFLQHGIKNDTESFNKLLAIMEHHDSDHLRKLTDKIHREITSNNLYLNGSILYLNCVHTRDGQLTSFTH